MSAWFVMENTLLDQYFAYPREKTIRTRDAEKQVGPGKSKF